MTSFSSYSSPLTGKFLGDIALPNIDYETEWQKQRLNKTLQQELEKLKQEVYHEGLQVEEEGLTDIIRKKTKQLTPDLPAGEKQPSKSLNEATVYVSGSQPVDHKSLNQISQRHNDNDNAIIDSYYGESQIKATIIDNNDNIIQRNTSTNQEGHQEGKSSSSNPTPSSFNGNDSDSSSTIAKNKKNAKTTDSRNIDHNRIQSDTKDIVIDDSGDNIISNNHVSRKLASRTLLTPPTTSKPVRTTQANRFSNSGGNGRTLEDVQVLNGDGTITAHKRHRRRRRQGNGRKNNSTDEAVDRPRKKPLDANSDTYQARVERLKSDLGNPTLSINDPNLKYLKKVKTHSHKKVPKEKQTTNRNKSSAKGGDIHWKSDSRVQKDRHKQIDKTNRGNPSKHGTGAAKQQTSTRILDDIIIEDKVDGKVGGDGLIRDSRGNVFQSSFLEAHLAVDVDGEMHSSLPVDERR